MAFLQQYLDPELEVSEDDTKDLITKQEIERLNKMLAVAQRAQTVPRRLGAEAGDDELALDKRQAKRIAHVASQSIAAWGGHANLNVGDVAREAAQVNWRNWWEQHRTWLLNRMRYIATWQYKTGSEERWAKSALVRLQNELRWLEYAFRD